MKKLIILLLLTAARQLGYSQNYYCPAAGQDLSYSGYHVVFSDDFCYNPPTFKNDPVFQNKWVIEREAANNWSASSWYKADKVTMPVKGIVTLTANLLGPNPDPDMPAGMTHESGNLVFHSPNYASIGIIEVRLKVPPAAKMAKPTIWIVRHMGPGMEYDKDVLNVRETEIDIIDQDDSRTDGLRSNIFTTVSPVNTDDFQSTHLGMLNSSYGTTDMSDGFHTYSCLWTPWRVTIYFDGKYVTHFDYDIDCGGKSRTFPDIYEFRIALQTKAETVDGTTMDIDWVRYLQQNCSNVDFTITPSSPHYDIMPYPLLPPLQEQFNTMKYRTITIGQNPAIVSPQQFKGTILEARGTTISSNFEADQNLYVTQEEVDAGDGNKKKFGVNGYFEIRSATSCPEHPEYPFNTSTDPEAPWNSCPPDMRQFDEHNVIGSVNEPIIRKIKIHPNPATEIINITDAPESAHYTIVDAIGRTVLEGRLVSSSLDLTNMQTGHYVLYVRTMDGNKYWTKFVKQ
jgi:beta-glucanase (GH16 family)